MAVVLPLFLLAVVQAGCELLGDTSVPDWGAIEEVRYGRHVQFLFDEYCTSCHGGDRRDAGLDLSTWEGMAAGSSFGEAVIPFDAERSRMVRMVDRGPGGGHPADVGRDSLSAEEVAFLRRWIDAGAYDDTGRTPGGTSRSTVLVPGAGDGTVWMIDPDRLVVDRVIDLADLQFGQGARPQFVASGPGTGRWYVSAPGAGAVLAFEAGGTLTGIIPVERPGPLSVSADGSLLAIGRTGLQDTEILTVETALMRTSTADVLFGSPSAVAVRPQGGFVLVASRTIDQAVVLSESRSVISVTGIDGPRHAAGQAVFVPSGDRAFVTGTLSNQLIALDFGGQGVLRQIGAVDVPAEPVQPAVSRDGILVAVASASGAVTIIDARTLSVRHVMRHEGLAEPQGAVFAAGRLFVSSRNRNGAYVPRRSFAGPAPGTVLAIDPVSGNVLRVLEVGREPAGLAALDSSR